MAEDAGAASDEDVGVGGGDDAAVHLSAAEFLGAILGGDDASTSSVKCARAAVCVRRGRRG